jgi:tetratricopeptide (TPR) repeat protein
MEEFLAEADFYFQQGLFDEAEFLYRKLTKLDPDNSDIAARITRLEAEKTATAPAPAPAAPSDKAGPPGGQDDISALESDLDRVFADESAPAAPGLKITVSGDSEAKEGEFSDFLSELRQELDTDEIPTPVPVANDEESLSEIFQEFQAGIKEQLGEEDFETHYNLGIAYKEMGLMEEALGEFVLSEKSVARRLDSISMIALCYKDMGREEEAVAKLEEGLDLAGEGSDEQKGLLYDLVELYQKVGRTAEAAETLERLKGIDSSYRDVSSRTAAAAPKAPAASAPAPAEGGQDSPKKKKPKVSYL